MRGRNLKLLIFACALITAVYLWKKSYQNKPEKALDPNLLEYVQQLMQEVSKSSEALAEMETKISSIQSQRSDVGPAAQIVDLQDIRINRGSNEQKQYNINTDNMVGDTCQLALIPAQHTDIQMTEVVNSLSYTDIDGGVWKQGFDINPDLSRWTSENPLKVFVIPHSHDDPGWIKTYDKYFTAQVQHILDNALAKLVQFPKMRFIYAEISFFSRWFESLQDQKKQQVKLLINEGRLELVTGGWVMPDEAAAHYHAMIDQIIEGHTWIRENIGEDVKPKSGWSIDPFGHSSTMAYILKLSGLKNMLVQRIHYSVKKHFAQNKQLEFNWRQTWDNEGSSDIFCHMMPFYSYDVPHTCGPDPKVCCQFDFLRLPGGRVSCPWGVSPVAISNANVQERSDKLVDQYRKKSMLYKSNVLLIPLGDDFRYDTESEWNDQYNNYEKLFDFINSNQQYNVQAQFGTLSDYFNALREEQGNAADDTSAIPDFPVLTGDFHTYADRVDHYWTGYYTSRPFHKNWDRNLEMTLRSAEIIFSLANTKLRSSGRSDISEKELHDRLTTARRSLGLFQHHDGITGTAKDFVVVDYGNRMMEGWKVAHEVIKKSAEVLLTDKPGVLELDVEEYKQSQNSLILKNVITLDTLHNKRKSVVLYNSLPHDREEIITIHVNYPQLSMRTDSKNVQCQISPIFTGQKEGDISSTVFELSFLARVPALGLATFNIEVSDKNPCAISDVIYYNSALSMEHKIFKIERRSDPTLTIRNTQISAEISTDTGMIKSMKDVDGVKHRLDFQFMKYSADSRRDHSAGAYLFLPRTKAESVGDGKPLMRVILGTLYQRVISYRKNVEHNIKLLNTPGPESVGIEVYNIDNISPESNYELVMQISTDLQDQSRTFFSDLNGFTLHKRKYQDKLKLQGNVYPMTSQVFLEHQSQRLSILTAQSAGVAVLEPGQFQIFLDRRLNQDDNRGLGQGVKDNVDTLSRFFILLESRQHTQTMIDQPIGYPTPMANILYQHFVSPVPILPVLTGSARSQYITLNSPLPCDIHMINMRSLMRNGNAESSLLLLHRQATDCGMKTYGLTCPSSTTEIDISNLFKEFNIKNIESTSLTDLYSSPSITSPHLNIKSMHIATYKLTLSM